MVAGFAAGVTPHHLENRTESNCVILEVGDRASGDTVSYPDEDLEVALQADGQWLFNHKDGSPY